MQKHSLPVLANFPTPIPPQWEAMAEAVGFILAIAGLYSSCIDVFEQIRAARSFGKDYEILITRYDVRKARFLQWGDGIGLLNEASKDRHPALDQPEMLPMVEKLLHCIKMLLTDTESLKTKYRLKYVSAEEQPQQELRMETVVSCRRRDLFKISYARFRSRVQTQQSEASLVKLARSWDKKISRN